MAREASAALRTLLRARLHLATSPWIGWLAAQLLGAAPATIAFVVASGEGSRTIRYLLALAAILAVEQLVAMLLRRRIGPEPSSPADFLTLARAAIGATLVALVLAGFAQRLSLTGTLAWVTALLGVTALDWLDGPLARWVGPTQLGRVLDIEADSWLTLCCAAGCRRAAVRGGAG